MNLDKSWTLTSGNMVYVIGNFFILRGFFDTIAVRLEDCFAGSKYPYLMRKIYQRQEISGTELDSLLNEICDVEKEFADLTIDDVVWKAKDISYNPNYEPKDKSGKSYSLQDYFQNEEGWSLIDMFKEAIGYAKRENGSLRLKKF